MKTHTVRLLSHAALKRAIKRGRVEAVVSHQGNHKAFGAIAIMRRKKRGKR